ncbi:MAG TPA: hypothetical protein VNY52_09425 [Solirubrobacteraceae bacterium]|jgi:hypothetical protein|nr:hypothetical protein [Solirubrobacteraceae bacterium]
MKLRPTCVASMVAILAVAVGGCGSQSNAAQNDDRGHASIAEDGGGAKVALIRRVSRAPVVGRPGQVRPTWRVAASVGGQPAAWIAQRSGVTLLRFDQRLVRLDLHAGSGEPRGHGWRYGDRIGASEIHRVVAAFNGGFKLGYGSVGFEAYGRVGVPLAAGLGSIVTYRNGTTEIGAWHRDVPARGLAVVSVLQNLHLLVDRGVVAPTVQSCIVICWGKTVGGLAATARSALGIASNGQLVWAAGERLTPATLAHALVDAGVVRAVELDINPGWVSGYLYIHHSGGPTAVGVVPGQEGIPKRLLGPDRRDFFTIIANAT